jgi:phosphoenolpyruvate carboxykinase (ATP)
MNITHTRAMVHAALGGQLDGVPTTIDPIFGVEVPTTCPGVPAELLLPRATWQDTDAYDRKARDLARMFRDNFAAFADGVSEEIRDAGPVIPG